MDPLVRFRDAHSKGLIPDDVYDLTLKRVPIAVAGIDRIEKASGIQYPVAYVEPSLVLSSSDSNSYEYGILFARTIPVMFEEKFQVVIQISAPLIAYGLKGTIHAILAHEFLHFLELLRKISKMELLSDEISGNLFENVYTDETRLFEPKVVFKDRMLLNHITKGANKDTFQPMNVNFGLFPPVLGVKNGRRNRKERYQAYTERAKQAWLSWLK